MAFPSTRTSTRSWTDVIDELEAPGRYGHRGRASDRRHVRTGVRGAAVRVQDGHRARISDLHRSGLSEDPRGPDRRSTTANPDLEGPWNSQIFVDAEATGGRIRSGLQRRSRRPRPRSSRSMLADLLKDFDAIVAPTNGPAWLTDPVGGDLGDDFSPFIGSSSRLGDRGWAEHHRSRGVRRWRRCRSASTFIGGAWDEPDLIGFAFDFEAGNPGQGSAAVPADAAVKAPRAG